jgi:hypothetical protein
MSEHSPGVVENSEQLALFVFHPMHHIDKNGNAKPNIFSHVHSTGRSVQRDTVATTNEIIGFAHKFLDADERRIWKGVLLAKCNDLRDIMTSDSNRSVCIYDTAEKSNPSHAEIGQTQRIIEEADQVELRHDLLVAFGEGKILPPTLYRQGTIWESLPTEIQTRQ